MVDLFEFDGVGGGEDVDLRLWPVEDRDSALAGFCIAINICEFRGEEAVCRGADLVGSAVVDAEGGGAATDVDAEGLPGEGRLKDALAEIASEEEAVEGLGIEQLRRGGLMQELGEDLVEMRIY